MSFVRAVPQTLLLLAVLFSSWGCASYSPAGSEKVTADSLLESHVSTLRSETCDARVVVLNDKELSRNYVGLDPAKANMVPVFLKFTNWRKDPVKVDILGSFMRAEGEVFNGVSIDEAIARATRSDAQVVGWTAGFAVLGGVVGGMTAAFASAEQVSATNQSLEEDYHIKSFKPSLVKNMTSGEGLVFFDVPASEQQRLDEVVLRLVDLSSNTSELVTVKLGTQSRTKLEPH